MVSRRSVLQSASTLAVATATAGLAGCTYEVGNPDADSDGDEPTPSSGPDGGDPSRDDGPDDGDGSDTRDTPPDDRDTPDLSGELATLRTEFGELIADLRLAVEGPGRTIDDEQIRQRLDELGTKLEETRDKAGSREQSDKVRTLEQLRRLLDRIVESINAIGTGARQLGDAVDGVGKVPFEDTERRIQEGAEQIRSGNRGLDRINGLFDEIRSSLEPFDEIDTADIEWIIDRIETIGSVMQGISDGMRPWVQGYDIFRTATTSYDDEQYQEAARKMSQSKSIFADAVQKLQAAKADAPPDMVSVVEAFLCIPQAYEDAAGHYQTAAKAYLEGDEETATAEEQEAEAALDRCD